MTVRLADRMHYVAHLLFGFPAPRPPRPGKLRPSLSSKYTLAHGGNSFFILACSS